MKSLAISKLRQEFDGEFTRCVPEVHLNVSHTGTDAEFRRPDAFVEFDHTHPVYGSGLIVEVQFQNKGKEIPIVTRDYLDCEYSVYWALPRDFTETEIFDRLETAFESDTPFAHSVSRFSKGDLEDVNETDLLWQDPIPDCDHVWKEFDQALGVDDLVPDSEYSDQGYHPERGAVGGGQIPVDDLHEALLEAEQTLRDRRTTSRATDAQQVAH